jgi:DDE superfamily endonuclease
MTFATNPRVKEPAMSFWCLPAVLTSVIVRMARYLDRRSGDRLKTLMPGVLFARGRRTCTAWFRAAKITTEFRQAYTTINSVGRKVDSLAAPVLCALKNLSESAPSDSTPQSNDGTPSSPGTPGKARRIFLAQDDTPTPRYGPAVEGCGIHHNPTPGPAGEEHVYGHVFVTSALIKEHPHWGIIALPLMAQAYIRKIDLVGLPKERHRSFQTKLEMAIDQVRWAKLWLWGQFDELWVLVDGGYAKKSFLKPAKAEGCVVVSRLRRDAALRSVPEPKKPGQRGRQATYGKQRISLAKRAGHQEGWQEVECVQYGVKVTKTIKSFLATWVPAGGLIRVVLVREDHGWVAFFCTKADATAVEILEGAANRGAIEQTFKDVKEVWGAGQQQVRNIDSNEGCFNMNLWWYSLVEAWAWERPEEQVCDRSACPWDHEPRRPSHNDKRKALQREVIEQVIQQGLSQRPTREEIREVIDQILAMAA